MTDTTTTAAGTSNIQGSALKFLVIRRDNIGDLVCTTPLLHLLRQYYPTSRVHVLVNTYNRAILDGHPDVDAVHTYAKTKHGAGLSALGRRLRLVAGLWRERIDYAILAGSTTSRHALNFARWVSPRHIIGYVEPDSRHRTIDIAVSPSSHSSRHEVEAVCRLLEPLGIEDPPPPMRIFPNATDVEDARRKLNEHRHLWTGRLIGIHISTRKPTNRWPDQKYIELIRRLHSACDATFLLLWAPGDSTNPRHPGDDASAAAIKRALPHVRLIVYPMGPLEQLIADLSFCDWVVTSDGGAMHIAAALGKPILCFFGETDATHWRPWAVPHILLQPPSRQAADIGVDEAVAGVGRLLNCIGASAIAHASGTAIVQSRSQL